MTSNFQKCLLPDEIVAIFATAGRGWRPSPKSAAAISAQLNFLFRKWTEPAYSDAIRNLGEQAVQARKSLLGAKRDLVKLADALTARSDELQRGADKDAGFHEREFSASLHVLTKELNGIIARVERYQLGDNNLKEWHSAAYAISSVLNNQALEDGKRFSVGNGSTGAKVIRVMLERYGFGSYPEGTISKALVDAGARSRSKAAGFGVGGNLIILSNGRKLPS